MYWPVNKSPDVVFKVDGTGTRFISVLPAAPYNYYGEIAADNSVLEIKNVPGTCGLFAPLESITFLDLILSGVISPLPDLTRLTNLYTLKMSQTGIFLPPFPDSLRELYASYSRVNYGTIDFSLQTLTYVDVTSSGVTSFIPPEGIEYLHVSRNLLTELSIASDSLVLLNVSKNSIADLDLSGCPNLLFLYAENCPFSSLDISACSGLKILNIGVGAYGTPLYNWPNQNYVPFTDLHDLEISGTGASNVGLPQSIIRLQLSNNPIQYYVGMFDLPFLERLEIINCGFNNDRIRAILTDLETFHTDPARPLTIKAGSNLETVEPETQEIIDRLTTKGWTITI